MAQAESLRYKLLGGLAVRRWVAVLVGGSTTVVMVMVMVLEQGCACGGYSEGHGSGGSSSWVGGWLEQVFTRWHGTECRGAGVAGAVEETAVECKWRLSQQQRMQLMCMR